MGIRHRRASSRRLLAVGYALRVGTARAIALRPSATARRIMRARGLVVVTTRERGASAKGPRSTRRVIRVAA